MSHGSGRSSAGRSIPKNIVTTSQQKWDRDIQYFISTIKTSFSPLETDFPQTAYSCMASEVKGIFTAEKLLLGRVGVETGKEGESQDAKVVFILLSALCSHTITNVWQPTSPKSPKLVFKLPVEPYGNRMKTKLWLFKLNSKLLSYVMIRTLSSKISKRKRGLKIKKQFLTTEVLNICLKYLCY